MRVIGGVITKGDLDSSGVILASPSSIQACTKAGLVPSLVTLTVISRASEGYITRVPWITTSALAAVKGSINASRAVLHILRLNNLQFKSMMLYLFCNLKYKS